MKKSIAIFFANVFYISFALWMNFASHECTRSLGGNCVLLIYVFSFLTISTNDQLAYCDWRIYSLLEHLKWSRSPQHIVAMKSHYFFAKNKEAGLTWIFLGLDQSRPKIRFSQIWRTGDQTDYIRSGLVARICVAQHHD